MKFNLSIKIFLVSLLVTISCVASMVLALHVVNEKFEDYIQLKEIEKLEYMTDTLANFYAENEGWGSLIDNRDLWSALLESGWTERDSLLSIQGKPEPITSDFTIMVIYQRDTNKIPPIWDPLNLGPRICLFDEEKKFIIGLEDKNIPIGECSLLSIDLEGKSVGWLGLRNGLKLSHPLDQAFRKNQSMIFYMMGGTILLVLSIIVILFSKHMLTPINRLAEATKALTQRNFRIRIPVESTDELGNLAERFNNMAQKLENYELKQRQWLSDISHELRTPLSVLIGEIEALQDGIRKPDKVSFISLGDEAKHLEKLVNDLHDLSLAEAGAIPVKKEVIKPLPILTQAVDIFQNRFKSNDMSIEVELDPASADLQMIGDPDRLIQLFSNIFENAINYTTKPGRLIIRQTHKADQIKLIFEDSGPGVHKVELARLFDRLYRSDPSRSRRTGGSGLGLAICKSIVEKHNGEIRAQNVQEGGLMIEILLPVENNTGD
ncbi:ATP-binding protein [Deltaproteobacteria bacterium]|nr:ATP-binding protein [Deltaproteobacteria bacterium]